MSEAIRCEACRWWREIQTWRGMRRGVCEVDLPVYVCGDPNDYTNWYQPVLSPESGCSRGEPKPSPPTVSDGVLVAMVDGLPVFCSENTGDAT